MKQNITLFLLMVLAITINAQTLSTPPSGNNQKSVVTQYIGSIVHVSVKYNSPDVTAPNGDDRTGQIWGQLVPYGLTDLGFGLRNPSPWRAGANENTIIKFSHDVEIEGQPLKAGKYGLHLIVEEEGPWTWIFSNNYSAWGSYFYVESDDALRVQVNPEDSEFHEWLTYEFTDRQEDNAELSMYWENKRVPMRISIPDMVGVYASTFEKELQGSAGFNYQNLVAASGYLAQNNYNLDQALTWAEAAVSAPFIGVENWSTLQNKATVLSAMGDDEGSRATMQQAIEHPATTSFQIHGYGRQLIAQGKTDEALAIFEYNYQKFEGAWPTSVGMARGLSAVGRYSEALKYAETAHNQAPDQLNKDSMAAAVEKLKQKQDIN